MARGQRMKLTDLTAAKQLQVALNFDAPNVSFDFSCFGLDENGKLSDDRYFIFYNQTQSPENSLQLTHAAPREARFAVDLARLPQTITRLVFVATVDGVGTMSGIARGQFSLGDAGGVRAQLALQGSEFGREKAIMVAEVYFKGEWRVAAVGQGFAEGLDAVLRHYGGEVATEESVSPAPPLNPSPSPAPPNPNPPNASEGCCIRCGKNVGFFGQLLGINALNRSTRRCKTCESEIQNALNRLRGDFARAGQSGVLDTSKWNELWNQFESARTGVSRTQALEFLRPDVLRFMERLVAMAAADGVITPEEETYFRQMSTFLELPGALQAPFLARLEHVKKIAAIREGHLPRVSSGNAHLDAGEICHLSVGTTYYKPTARSVNPISGRLIATSKKLIFLSEQGGTTVQFKNIMSVQVISNAIHLELSTRSGNGRYNVEDPEWCEAVVSTLTRMAKRQLLAPQSENPTRHIPQDVKNAVWQRDGGRCVQCANETYLEFDHIIPFSKGGANTVGNVQLLCRKCNGEKGDRI